jgi:hypothetical protein
LVNKFNHSLSQLLAFMYPEYPWLPWKFAQCPNSYWDDIQNQKKFVEWAANELNFREMSDWYSVTFKVYIPEKFVFKSFRI